MSFLDSWILLGLRNTAGAEILEGDVWGALNIEHAVVGPLIPTATVGPLWGSEAQPEPRSWRETSGEHKKSNMPSRNQEIQRLLFALSGARKYSQSRDPGGRRLESTEILEIQAGT